MSGYNTSVQFARGGGNSTTRKRGRDDDYDRRDDRNGYGARPDRDRGRSDRGYSPDPRDRGGFRDDPRGPASLLGREAYMPTMGAVDPVAPLMANPALLTNLAALMMAQRGMDPGVAVQQDPMAGMGYGGPLPPEASSTLYVEGLPSDATEREVAHIFRPFPGYLSLRILPKKNLEPGPVKSFHLCFVEFEDKHQASAAMHTLQGYRMDKFDQKGLFITYAKSERKERFQRRDERDRDRR